MDNLFKGFRAMVKKILPEPLLKPLRFIFQTCHLVPLLKVIIFPPAIVRNQISFFQRAQFVYRLSRISLNVPCPHREDQVLSFIYSFLSLPSAQEGCIVEAGSYKGGSTAKFSIATKLANRKLVIFDSFEGLPENKEPHDKSILGHSIKDWFKKGSFQGSFEEVKRNIEKYGEIDVCTFAKGWFDDTMPNFSKKICAVYIDVDLASSTKTCLKYLYPLMIPGGVLYSQDGDFPLVIEVFNDDEFWEREVGCRKPYIEGLGKKKLIKIVKPIEENEPEKQ